MNAIAPIIYSALRIRAWRALAPALDGRALAARVFGRSSLRRGRRRMVTRWLLRGGGRRVLVVTWSRGGQA